MRNPLFLILLGGLVASCEGPPEIDIHGKPLPTGHRPGASTNDVSAVRQPVVTCSAWNFNTGVCNKWKWTQAPAYFNDCQGDTNVYDGELVLISKVGIYDANCIYVNPALLPGGSIVDMSLNDWDTDGVHVTYYKSRLWLWGSLQDANGYPVREVYIPGGYTEGTMTTTPWRTSVLVARDR
jgi:hypothetical protein